MRMKVLKLNDMIGLGKMQIQLTKKSVRCEVKESRSAKCNLHKNDVIFFILLNRHILISQLLNGNIRYVVIGLQNENASKELL